ncbi:MAG: hypothetical protein AB7G93_12175 [Bdellovibrionales bacterium]
MRKLVALFAFVSVQAYACPDLAGSYTCTDEEGKTESVTIKQEMKDGVTVYDYNGSSVPADNVVYPVPDDESLKETTFRAWCADNMLKAQILSKYYSEGTYVADLELNLDFSKTEGGLKQVTTGALKNSGGEYPLNSEMNCVANAPASAPAQ